MERRVSAPALAKWMLACLAGVALAIMLASLPAGAKQAWAADDHPYSALMTADMFPDDDDPLTPNDLPGFTEVSYDEAMTIGGMAPTGRWFLIYSFTDDGYVQYIEMMDDAYGEIMTVEAKHSIFHEAMTGAADMTFYYVTGTPGDYSAAPVQQGSVTADSSAATDDSTTTGGRGSLRPPSNDDELIVYFGTNCTEATTAWRWLGNCGGPFNNGYMGMPDGSDMEFELIDAKGHKFLGFYQNNTIQDPKFDPTCKLITANTYYRWKMTPDLKDVCFWAIFDKLPTPIYENNSADKNSSSAGTSVTTQASPKPTGSEKASITNPAAAAQAVTSDSSDDPTDTVTTEPPAAEQLPADTGTSDGPTNTATAEPSDDQPEVSDPDM